MNEQDEYTSAAVDLGGAIKNVKCALGHAEAMSLTPAVKSLKEILASLEAVKYAMEQGALTEAWRNDRGA